jgi:hypothetical protein
MKRYRCRIQLLDENRSYAIIPPSGHFTFRSVESARNAAERHHVKGRARALIYPSDMVFQDRDAWDWSKVFTVAI